MDLLEIKYLIPRVVEWVTVEERRILDCGMPLDKEQREDAVRLGIENIDGIRLLISSQTPMTDDPELSEAAESVGLASQYATGICFRYGIYIKPGLTDQRRLLLHELTHTLQYERLGGIEPFLLNYLEECIQVGYPYGPLEREAMESMTLIK